MNSSKKMIEHTKEYMEMLETQGLPQIDYIIGSETLTSDKIFEGIKDSFKKTIWNDNYNDPDLIE